MSDPQIFTAATDNLLRNCAGLTPGDSLLVVYENPELGWYDKAVTKIVIDAAKSLAIETRSLEVGAPQNQRDDGVLKAMQQHDCTLFLSRIGDQDRFAEPLPGKKIVMCYVRSVEMLASSFAVVSYQATRDMKRALDKLLNQAQEIEIRCPLGTHCTLSIEPRESIEELEVTILRFPLGVVTPIDARTLNGRVALTGYLTPTGSRVYQPASLVLKDTVFAKLAAGRIVDFEGDPKSVAKINHHYSQVAEQFSIEANVVHSWHAGMHPGLSYRQPAADNPDRWSNTVFNHPRILHFHTCGNYAPGEICWIVKDQTVLLDGEPLWKNGILQAGEFEVTRDCLEKWPQLKELYAQPCGSIGI
jgi:hypothetical protein